MTGKTGWVSLNRILKKLFEFDSNVFRWFKDLFFKVLATNVEADTRSLASHSTGSLTLLGLSISTRICWPLWRGSTRPSWSSGRPCWIHGDAGHFVSSLAGDPLATLDGKMFCLVFLFCVWSMLWPELTFFMSCFVGIMDDFAWRPLVK